MNPKIQLPLFEDPFVLPTGKCHISYSEIVEHQNCSFKHKLKHIDKIDLDGASVHTIFGHVVHNALEEYILTGKMKPIEECKLEFEKSVSELFFTAKAITVEEAKEFLDVIEPIINGVPKYLDQEFPGWKPVAAEDKLFEPVEGQKNKYFKGFIDLIIKVPRVVKGKSTTLSGLKGVAHHNEWDYYLIDYKTTNTGWIPSQKQSFEKQMQLVFYKHFWCTKTNIPFDNVKCAFMFLRRKPTKEGKIIEHLVIDVNQTAVEKALGQLHNALNQIQQRRAFKNKMSCRFCQFSGTVHCP